MSATQSYRALTIEEYGRWLVTEAKRREAMGWILQMPEEGLDEMITSLIDIWQFNAVKSEE